MLSTDTLYVVSLLLLLNLFFMSLILYNAFPFSRTHHPGDTGSNVLDAASLDPAVAAHATATSYSSLHASQSAGSY